ncbi:nucleoid-associated protein [Mesonia sp.]|uniref:nucleoid-associated protein n=1 Tax=Mesonia sp. TaxID=1960830 RepID=UPI0017680F54|nr:nucleoid-associated protein [Mesonia sp.]HIB37896.1 hypothetical protein [Mesonia sp.]
MSIRKIIIHGLEKKQHSKDVKPLESKTVLNPDDELVQNFCEDLVNSYKNESKVSTAIFNEKSLFKGDIDRYQREEINFVEFSLDALAKMEHELKGTSAATGGKFVFLDASDKDNMFYVFMIRDTEGEQLKYSEKKKKFEINQIEYADTKNLAMAVRINRRIYNDKSGGKNYLSFTYGSTKQNEVSGYFSDWVGAKNLLKSIDYSRGLKQAINIIGDIDEGDYKGTTSEKLQNVINYASSNSNNKIDIYNLSEQLYGKKNRNLIRETCERSDISFTESFNLDSRSKNLFKTISVKASNIKLNFPRNYVDEGIIDYDDDIVVIKDASLAQKIKADIEDES